MAVEREESNYDDSREFDFDYLLAVMEAARREDETKARYERRQRTVDELEEDVSENADDMRRGEVWLYADSLGYDGRPVTVDGPEADWAAMEAEYTMTDEDMVYLSDDVLDEEHLQWIDDYMTHKKYRNMDYEQGVQERTDDIERQKEIERLEREEKKRQIREEMERRYRHAVMEEERERHLRESEERYELRKAIVKELGLHIKYAGRAPTMYG